MIPQKGAVYLITGANRGIGLGLVSHIVETFSDAFIYAGVRNPVNATELHQLSSKYPDRIAISKYISGDAKNNEDLAKEIRNRHGYVDTVIANAAICRMKDTALETPVADFRDHFEVNVLGTITLFQAIHDVLKSSTTPRFVPISSGAGSIGHPAMAFPVRNAAYGASKVALNYVTRKIHFENEWLISFPLAPGIVDTDMFAENSPLKKAGVMDKIEHKMPVRKPREAAGLIVGVINESTRARDGGEFLSLDGTRICW